MRCRRSHQGPSVWSVAWRGFACSREGPQPHAALVPAARRGCRGSACPPDFTGPPGQPEPGHAAPIAQDPPWPAVEHAAGGPPVANLCCHPPPPPPTTAGTPCLDQTLHSE
ncbi:hypothetical protein MRX96_030622 [Rhipicephalus microplus]